MACRVGPPCNQNQDYFKTKSGRTCCRKKRSGYRMRKGLKRKRTCKKANRPPCTKPLYAYKTKKGTTCCRRRYKRKRKA